jgi:NAD(P)-dependent dehydrogenase (short-subunit alcohol dehydrogenase family)
MKNMDRFKGQVAVITGGADGLGKGIARRIGLEGATVVLLDINETLVSKTVSDFLQEGIAAAGHVSDISNEHDVETLFTSVLEQYGKIDIAVNAAGIVGPTSTPIADYGLDDFDKVCNVNLKGSFLITKYAVKAMLPANYGRILLLASIAGKEGNPNMVGYSASKAGVIGLVKGVGKEYATTGITVNAMAPAVIKTAMNNNTSPQQLAYMTAKIPMGRLGTVEETASLAAWILSAESSFNTGFVFDLSGGRATY